MPRTLTKADLQARLKEFQENVKEREAAFKDQIARMDARRKSLNELKRWLEKRHLTPKDVLLMYRDLMPKRAGQPAKSKNPLPPDGQLGLDADFSAAIREARQAKNMTAEALGRSLGCTGGAVNNWEAGRGNPTAKRREQLIRVLGLPAKYSTEPKSKGNGQLVRDGQLVDAKGDPDFRR